MITRIIVLVLLLCGGLWADQRTITGSLGDALGAGGNGIVLIEWPHYTDVGGTFNPAGRRQIRVSAGAYTSFSLDSSQDATPSFSYTVTYNFGSSNTPRCSWSIPAGSSSVTIISIQTCPALPSSPGSSVSYSTITGLTTCGIAFGGAGGALTIDATNLCWNDGNNRLGIKTNSPTVTLDVSGNVRFFDQTPTTGSTVTMIRLGAGQGTTLPFQVESNAGVVLGAIAVDGGYNFYAGGVRTGVFYGNSLYTTAGCTQWDNDTDLATVSIDTQLCRNAAGILEINNGTPGTFRDMSLRTLRHNPLTVATLPSTPSAGDQVYISDSVAGDCVTGSGTIKLYCTYNGTSWDASL